MKIIDLVEGIGIMITNEESDFIEKYGDRINLKTLDEHCIWMARNLVRKGIYETEDNSPFIVKK